MKSQGRAAVTGSGPLHARPKRTARGLDVIQSVYAFAMALGLTDVFIGSKTFLNDVILGDGATIDGRALVIGLMLVNILLLGLRFFWVPRNLVELVHVAAKGEAALHPDGGGRKIDLSSFSVALHLIMIFVHGALFFMICDEFEYIAFLASSSIPVSGSMFTGFLTMQACLLLINAGWISLIKRQEARIERKAGIADDGTVSTGSVWWMNNLASALVATAPFAVLGACRSELGQCAAQSYEIGANMLNPSPGSAHQFAVIFEGVVEGLARLGIGATDPALLWALGIFLLNSGVDLFTTGRDYLFFDEVEWEARPAGEPAPGGRP